MLKISFDMIRVIYSNLKFEDKITILRLNKILCHNIIKYLKPPINLIKESGDIHIMKSVKKYYGNTSYFNSLCSELFYSKSYEKLLILDFNLDYYLIPHMKDLDNLEILERIYYKIKFKKPHIVIIDPLMMMKKLFIKNIFNRCLRKHLFEELDDEDIIDAMCDSNLGNLIFKNYDVSNIKNVELNIKIMYVACEYDVIDVFINKFLSTTNLKLF